MGAPIQGYGDPELRERIKELQEQLTNSENEAETWQLRSFRIAVLGLLAAIIVPVILRYLP